MGYVIIVKERRKVQKGEIYVKTECFGENSNSV
jgi:hypothetical protein